MNKVDKPLTPVVSSPCINLCELNDESICVGCYRSIDEIINWLSLSSYDQLFVIEQANSRKILAD
ncbi:MAG: putative Fe-S protein YdhL (DUF1289 family) [Cocleimonas sp.]|jgi:predicted Fe-S protein YdhL (DUF1289 family)